MIDKDRKKVLDKVKVELLQCRVLGHWWWWFDVKRRGRKVAQLVVCRNCDAVKVQNLNRDFVLKNSHTNYKEGYKIEGMGRLSAEDNAYLRQRFERYVRKQAEGMSKK